MALPIFNCFGKNGLDDLQSEWAKRKEANPELSDKEIARDILKDEHKKMFDELNGIRSSINKNVKDKSAKLTIEKYPTSTGQSEAIKKINTEHDQKIEEAKNNISSQLKPKENAVQEQTTGEGLLRDTGLRGESELQGVEQRNQPQEPATESAQQQQAAPIQEKVNLGSQARDLASKLRSGDKSVLPSWLKSDLPKGTKKGGATIDEAFATALETFADIYDKTKDFAKAIEEGFKHIKGWFDENKVDYDEAELKKSFSDEMSKRGEGGVSGIAQRVREQRADVTGLKPADIGVGWTKEEAFQRGQQLIREGVDPQQVVDDFNKDNKISDDTIAVIQARTHELAKATDEAGDKYGINSNEYKDALKKEDEWARATKPMQTIWNRAGVAQQGEIDINTGSFTGLSRAFKEQKGSALTPEEEAQAKDLSQKVSELTKQVDVLKTKLSDVLSKAAIEAEKTTSKNIKEKAKQFANAIRKGKLSRPDIFLSASPASIVWDGAIEAAAKAVETGGTIAQAIADGIKHIQESDWYKNLSASKQKQAEQAYTDFVNSSKGEKKIDDVKELGEYFANKDDNKFTPQEAKNIWEYAKKEYIDKDADFDTMIHGVATDLGLRPDQIRNALASPKGAKTITEEMYRKQYQRNNAKRMAEGWVKSAGQPRIRKFFGAIPRVFFAAKVIGHGTVGFITHAGVNIFDIAEWKRYWPAFFKQFKFAYGDTGKYEKAMQDLVRDKDFLFWKRAGLAIDPAERYDDYQFIAKMFQKMGKVGKWLTAGDRGFNALKVYRLERAKALYNGLSAVEKADKNTVKEIAKLVNHSTGTSKIPLPESANVAFFAPRLEASRWNKLIVDPAKAVVTFSNWANASAAEKVAAKIVASRAGRIVGTYIGALVVNQALLSLTNSQQKINFTDPTQSDFLKFKIGGRTLDFTGGMISTIDFLGNLFHVATASKKDLGKDNRAESLQKTAFNYASGKFSPFASTAKDVITHHDFSGNTLPMFNDKPLHSWNKKLSWSEYLKQQQTPIPVSEAFRDLQTHMEETGVPKATANQILGSIFIGAVVGGTGLKVGEEPFHKSVTPFNEEDKKNPTFKYFLDRGMSLPNTFLGSETVHDKENKTIKKITDYPKGIQDKYQKQHKQELQLQLKKIKDRGYVYTDGYKDKDGNRTISVTFTKGNGLKRVSIQDLNEAELAKVLSLSQSMATTNSKEKIFGKQ